MARPKKEGLDYFPVDVDFDEKVEAIIMMHEHGLTWVIRFWQKAYKTMEGIVDFNGLFGELFANKCHITTEEHSKILQTAINIKFCYEVESGIYTSKGIQKRISTVSKERSDAIKRQNTRNKIKRKEKKSKVKDCPVNSANNSVSIRLIIPPTYEMVHKYCEDRKNGIDAQSFIDFYSSKGWMVGKNKMVDWQSAIGTWEKRRDEDPKEKRRREFKEMMDEKRRAGGFL